MDQRQLHHQQYEFLPLCDVLFNIISLASYFCDVVFDLAMAYALAHNPLVPQHFFPITCCLVGFSLIVSQVVSVRWYLWGARGKLKKATTTSEYDTNSSSQEKKSCGWAMGCVLLFHSAQVGVLWRYFKLFIPVDLTYVKHEVRELCVLRLIHAFCEAAPMLLLQLYLLSVGIRDKVDDDENDLREIKGTTIIENDKLAELTAVSAGLSLWSVCWAVASFSKGAARLRNLERLVLTWLGVLAQLAWRLGTVSARVGALVAYASLYGGQWLLVVPALHWLSMITWLLLTPDGLFHGGERLAMPRKIFLVFTLAFVYVFAYINLHETNHRQKMLIFYTVMFLENSLLVGVWVVGINRSDLSALPNHPRPTTLVLTFLALFFGGLAFMALYYRFFHVRRLRYETGGRMNGSSVVTTLTNHDTMEEKQINYFDEKKMDEVKNLRKSKLNNGGIPGVFNCRFANPAVAAHLNRKKKKPTTFVPPPPPNSLAITTTTTTTTASPDESKQWLNSNGNSRQLIPFWKRPLSSLSLHQLDDSTDHNSSNVSGSLSVNLIREKLRQKKQQQLRELRAIQEEIREGKLIPPPSASTSSYSSNPSVSNQQPPPNTKLHMTPNSHKVTERNVSGLSSWPPVKMHCLRPPPPSLPSHVNNNNNTHPSWKSTQRAETPEILLAPRCLSHHYWAQSHGGNNLLMNRSGEDGSSKGDANVAEEASDTESSQISLPRSYTLPREFKYTNGLCAKDRSKAMHSRFYLPSTNSSDGDVDSADNEEETDTEFPIRGRSNNNNNNYTHFHEDNDQRLDYSSYSNVNRKMSEQQQQQTIHEPSFYLNSHAARSSNQLQLRTKVKHETKL